MRKEMNLREAAEKWGLSVNWVRQLVKSGRVRARLATEGPLPYYLIPIDEPKPASQRLTPLPKGMVVTPSGKREPKRAVAPTAVAKTSAKAKARRKPAEMRGAAPPPPLDDGRSVWSLPGDIAEGIQAASRAVVSEHVSGAQRSRQLRNFVITTTRGSSVITVRFAPIERSAEVAGSGDIVVTIDEQTLVVLSMEKRCA